MTHWIERIAPRPRTASTCEDRVRYAGDALASGDYLEPLRVIYDHELIVYEGSTFVVEFEGGQAITCPPDSFIIIPPGRLHIERNIGGQPGHRHWCHFDWIYQPGYGQTPVITYSPGQAAYHLCRSAPDFVPACPLSARIADPQLTRRRMRDIARRVADKAGGGRFEARVILLHVLITLFCSGEAPGAETHTPKAGLASRIRKRLDLAAHQGMGRVSLPDALDELGYSYEHMCRVFRATYGVAPLSYVQAVRIARAQVLLRSTPLDIAEIGYRVGFSSPAYFSKIFRRLTGQSPGEFRLAQP
jgi:AraC-like DNA-binding protein